MKAGAGRRMGWLLTMLALALLPAARAQANTDLIGYWPFDDGIGVTTRDQAGKSDFKLIGNPVWTKNVSGYCLLFDGSDERPVYGANAGPNLYQGLGIFEHGTISVWTLPFDGGYAQPNPGDTAGQGRARIASIDNIHVGLYDGCWCGLAYDFQRVEYIRGPAMVKDQWVYLVMTWDKIFARFYVNGREAVRSEGPYLRSDLGGRDISMWESMYVSYPYHRQMYKGYVDDWKLYKRVLTPAEIAAEYEREKDKRAITAPNAKDKTKVP